jgi:hypothetical protein
LVRAGAHHDTRASVNASDNTPSREALVGDAAENETTEEDDHVAVDIDDSDAMIMMIDDEDDETYAIRSRRKSDIWHEFNNLGSCLAKGALLFLRLCCSAGLSPLLWMLVTRRMWKLSFKVKGSRILMSTLYYWLHRVRCPQPRKADVASEYSSTSHAQTKTQI